MAVVREREKKAIVVSNSALRASKTLSQLTIFVLFFLFLLWLSRYLCSTDSIRSLSTCLLFRSIHFANLCLPLLVIIIFFFTLLIFNNILPSLSSFFSSSFLLSTFLIRLS